LERTKKEKGMPEGEEDDKRTRILNGKGKKEEGQALGLKENQNEETTKKTTSRLNKKKGKEIMGESTTVLRSWRRLAKPEGDRNQKRERAQKERNGTKSKRPRVQISRGSNGATILGVKETLTTLFPERTAGEEGGDTRSLTSALGTARRKRKKLAGKTLKRKREANGEKKSKKGGTVKTKAQVQSIPGPRKNERNPAGGRTSHISVKKKNAHIKKQHGESSGQRRLSPATQCPAECKTSINRPNWKKKNGGTDGT